MKIDTGHCNDVIMDAVASQITSLTIVYSTVDSDADQRKHQSSASLAFVWGIHRGPVNSPHKWPVTRKMFPFDDVTSCGWFGQDRAYLSGISFNLVWAIMAIMAMLYGKYIFPVILRTQFRAIWTGFIIHVFHLYFSSSSHPLEGRHNLTPLRYYWKGHYEQILEWGPELGSLNSHPSISITMNIYCFPKVALRLFWSRFHFMSVCRAAAEFLKPC